MLIAVFMFSEGLDRRLVATYRTESECVAAAEAFVAKNPAFEFRHASDDKVIEPVVRSYVECVIRRDGQKN